MPDVVVWEADGTVDVGVGYGAAIARRLLADHLRVVVVPLTERRPDGPELAASRHVISGGGTAVNDGVEWLTDTRRLLCTAGGAGRRRDGDVGRHLLRRPAAGCPRGRPEVVGPHPRGMRAGLVAATDSMGDRVVVSSFHYHHIDRRRLEAAGAEVTVSSPATPVQAYRVGLGLRGTQFHPELDPDALAVAIELHRPVVEATSGSVERALASIEVRRHRWDDGPWRSLMADAGGRLVVDESLPSDAQA